MTSSPALCPLCGEMLEVYEADAGIYLGCPELLCGWMSAHARFDNDEGDRA